MNLISSCKSMEAEKEKLKNMNIFWLRPAYQKHPWLTRSRSSVYRVVAFFFLLASLALLALSSFDTNPGIFTYDNGLLYFKKTPAVLPMEFPLNCSAWNQANKTCPRTYPTKFEPARIDLNPKTCPDYFRWIHEDLKPWKQIGITKEMVEGGRRTAAFRLVILDGKLYVENYEVAKSYHDRATFILWGIVQLSRWYPGKLPDLELLFDGFDRPVIPRHGGPPYRGGPPPLFRFCSDPMSFDIVFPDWTFWGWPEVNIKPWRSVLEEIKKGNKKSNWKERLPYAYWKGNPLVAAWRGDLMKCNVTDKVDWNARLYKQDWGEEVKQGYNKSNLADQCTHRYKIYIEGWGWSVSEKYIFACDSPVLYVTPRFHDFFSRGMVPRHHYWPVRDSDKCRSVKFAVDYGNNHTEMAQGIGAAGSRFLHEDLKMEYVYDYMFHLLNEYAKPMKYKPSIPPNAIELCAETLACSTSESLRYREFMEESLEKSPSGTNPCNLPPPYGPEELTSFNDEKIRLTKEVEKWEDEYWQSQIKKQ